MSVCVCLCAGVCACLRACVCVYERLCVCARVYGDNRGHIYEYTPSNRGQVSNRGRPQLEL